MPETINQREQEIAAREIDLRRERVKLPGRIALAVRRVEELRGNGAKQGDPELEEATQHLRGLMNRERELPHLIATTAATRCRIEARHLNRDAAFLSEEHGTLAVEYQSALNSAKAASQEAERIRVRMESIEMRREGLRAQARPLEDFAMKATEFEGNRRLKLLDDAQREGLLLDMPPVAMSANGSSL